jgi:hypothetical protein
MNFPFLQMGRKCSVARCQSNYRGREKVKVFSFPDDEQQRNRWCAALPNKIEVNI